jgi:hypothetical protein
MMCCRRKRRRGAKMITAQRRKKIAHGFNRGSNVQSEMSPVRDERKILPLLPGFDHRRDENPALKRWAIFEKAARDLA